MSTKMHLWKLADDVMMPQVPPPRRKLVAAILRAAYRRFAGDPMTRRAVRRCLP